MGLERGQDCGLALGHQPALFGASKDYILKTKNQNPTQAMLHARSLERRRSPCRGARRPPSKSGRKPQARRHGAANNDTPFEMIPSTPTWSPKPSGIPGGPHCDVNSACSSFALHMSTLGRMREDKLPEFILCLQTSAYTTRIDYSPKSIDGYIFGDGACAQVLSVRHKGVLTVEPMIFETGPAQADEIVVDSAGHFSQNGASVREFSIRKTCEMFEQIALKKELYAEQVYTVAHQANYVMQDSILGHLHLPAERHIRNVREQGATYAAAAARRRSASVWTRCIAATKSSTPYWARPGLGRRLHGGSVSDIAIVTEPPAASAAL